MKKKAGQLATIFIAIFVILIIMIMVTVNINKTALTKTDTANAVDAGALAAGSKMADDFNYVAKQSQELKNEKKESVEDDYDDFYKDMKDKQFPKAQDLRTQAIKEAEDAKAAAEDAMGQSCDAVCSGKPQKYEEAFNTMEGQAIMTTEKFIQQMEAIKSEMEKYHETQLKDFREQIRPEAIRRWQTALATAFKYGLMNSGIDSKLTFNEKDKFYAKVANIIKNYETLFKDTGKSVWESNNNTDLNYNWTDNQHRAHTVNFTVTIQAVDTYSLKIANNDFKKEDDLLKDIIDKGKEAEKTMNKAVEYYSKALGVWPGACAAMQSCNAGICCCDTWQELCAKGNELLKQGNEEADKAIKQLKDLEQPIKDALKGLETKKEPFISTRDNIDKDDGKGTGNQIIAWIVDIMNPDKNKEPHDRRVRIDTTQVHGAGSITGAEGGQKEFWKFEYPVMKSYSIVNFNGEPPKGTKDGESYNKIDPEDKDGKMQLTHFPSIIETDKIKGQ